MSRATRAALAALAGLASMGPVRLASILRAHPGDEAFHLLAAGRRLAAVAEPPGTEELFDRLRAQAAQVSLDAVWRALQQHAVRVYNVDDPEYPVAFRHDPESPPVIFVQGDLGVLEGRRVGVVGTRNATAAGRATAFELGESLAAHGVAVVSGLALGIDAAAHRGLRAGDGRPVGVVANGLDVPYPRQHGDLWRWVGERGVLISERPPGCPPEPWRFPLRNRLIAALSEVLVVVESRERGGSLLTADQALQRGVRVMAVPGSPRCRAAHGTNKLLVDGADPVTGVDDVLVALGLDHHRSRAQLELAFAASAGDAIELAVLHACAACPSTLDMLASAIGCPVSEVALAVMRLVREGRLLDDDGWFEAAGSRLRQGGAPGSGVDLP
jgi:DNA processing protein